LPVNAGETDQAVCGLASGLVGSRMICVMQVTPGPALPDVRSGSGPLFCSANQDLFHE
jgi:hypothetical protein